jgi:2-amino-4-hydroxy-6-hydroxymethyldihydropteridine diphosphokinase
MNKVYLLLGSNRGDRERNLLMACAGIERSVGKIVKSSSVYETSPWGFEDPVAFYNQALEIETELAPDALLDMIHLVESGLGRMREIEAAGCSCSAVGYSPRTIDIDILFYASRIIFTDQLMIPHPRLHERLFTLCPMAELAGDFVHPAFKKTIKTLLDECTDRGEVRAL